ncbi:MAG TPA: hypothetical protein VI076_11450 [Actinopolymorphaceae bacterium]
MITEAAVVAHDLDLTEAAEHRASLRVVAAVRARPRCRRRGVSGDEDGLSIGSMSSPG